VAVAPLTSDELSLFQRLETQLTSAQHIFDLCDAYYDGAQRLEQLGLAIPPELQRFTVIVNWPRVVVDATADRLDVKGFRLPGVDIGDEELLRVWRASHMDEQDQMAKLDYLIYGRTYKCVGPNEADERSPLITVESPRSIITDRDSRTGRVTAALRLYDEVNGRNTKGTLYLPDETIYLDSADGPWNVADRDEHGLGVVPVVPTFRRRRTRIPVHRTLQGVSAMADVIPVTDAAARNITNAQVAQETHAVPARGVLGATKGDFVDQTGKPLPQWEAYFGSVWALGNPNAKTFQFDSSDMVNFERMMDLYARLASGVSALPPNYFGLAADDAASADAIRSREARHVKVAERDQVALGTGDAETLRIAARIRDGAWDDSLVGLETLWYDAGTPTTAQRADAVVKMHTATDGNGVPLLPAEAAYEELGYSPTKIKRLMEMRRREMANPYLTAQADGQRPAAAPVG
jgi:hypothetical protein